MDIHPADAAARQSVQLDELESFVVARGFRPRHFRQKAEDLGTLLEPAERQFTEYEGMNENQTVAQESPQPGVVFPQMIDPDRRVG